MISHTPGPWRLSPSTPTIILRDFRPIADSGELIGSAAGHPNSGFYPTEEEAIANARLIAAAPDLLKACQQALYALKGREHDGFLRDAIAKATGGAA